MSKKNPGKETVEEYIKTRNLNWKLIEFQSPTKTVEDAARLLGVDKNLIIKTLIVICSNNIYAAIVPGDKKLDMEKLKTIAGECRLAKPKEVLEQTGYPIGGVPPITLPQNIKLIIDKGILEKPKVYGGGGEENVLLEFSPKELVENAKATIADISA